MEKWKEYKATEYCLNVTDGTHDSPKRVKEGMYLITSKYIKDNKIDFDNAYKISEEDYNQIIKRSRVDQWDIIISMIGAYCGYCYIETSSKTDYAIKNVGLFKVGSELKSRWLYYYLISPLGKQQLSLLRTGSSQPYIALNSLRNLSIPVPGKNAMQGIVAILKSLDDRIEINRRINDNFVYSIIVVMLIWLLISLRNDNLGQQAQALFKSWFIDFDPFKDGEFEETEIGLIPKGWLAGSLEDITTQKAERVGDREDVKVLSPVTTGQLMLSEEYFTKQVFSESIAKYKVVEIGDFAYNPARVNIGSLGRNNYDFDGCVSPVYVVFSCKNGYAHLFDLYRKTEKFKTEVNLRAIGGVRQSLNYKDFAFIQCIVPPLHVVKEFNARYEHLLLMQKHTKEENNRLANLRDTLLPRLMSGELKVNEIENVI